MKVNAALHPARLTAGETIDYSDAICTFHSTISLEDCQTVSVAVVCQQSVDKLQQYVTILSPDVEQVSEFKELISKT
jgi:hypothetical protein